MGARRLYSSHLALVVVDEVMTEHGKDSIVDVLAGVSLIEFCFAVSPMLLH